MSQLCSYLVMNFINVDLAKSHFTVVYLVAKPLIWIEAEGSLVVIETSI